MAVVLTRGDLARVRLVAFPFEFVNKPELCGVFGDDGVSVVYVVRREGVDNLWGQRADGKGEPRQLTRFASGRIYAFDISHGDGRVVLARGNQSRYVVLLTADN